MIEDKAFGSQLGRQDFDSSGGRGCPAQRDGYNCGVHTAINALMLVKQGLNARGEIDDKVSPDTMKYYRNAIALSILFGTSVF